MKEHLAQSPSAGTGMDLAGTRAVIGGWANLSVVQYFVAEAAVIEAWAGPQPYSRSTGFISDLGAVMCGVHAGRAVCSPLHLLMNASFVVQGLAMLLGVLLLSTALLGVAATPVYPAGPAPGPANRFGPAVVRMLLGISGAGTVIVGFVPEDLGSPWHFVGALMFFIGGAVALLLLGVLWLRHTRMGWFVLACGAVSFTALVTGGLTRMDVPQPGTLERLMSYPITIGLAAAGLVIAQRVTRERKVVRAASRAAGPDRGP